MTKAWLVAMYATIDWSDGGAFDCNLSDGSVSDSSLTDGIVSDASASPGSWTIGEVRV